MARSTHLRNGGMNCKKCKAIISSQTMILTQANRTKEEKTADALKSVALRTKETRSSGKQLRQTKIN